MSVLDESRQGTPLLSGTGGENQDFFLLMKVVGDGCGNDGVHVALSSVGKTCLGFLKNYRINSSQEQNLMFDILRMEYYFGFIKLI